MAKYLDAKEREDPTWRETRRSFAPTFGMLVQVLKKKKLKDEGRPAVYVEQNARPQLLYTEDDRELMEEAWAMTTAHREDPVSRLPSCCVACSSSTGRTTCTRYAPGSVKRQCIIWQTSRTTYVSLRAPFRQHPLKVHILVCVIWSTADDLEIIHRKYVSLHACFGAQLPTPSLSAESTRPCVVEYG